MLFIDQRGRGVGPLPLSVFSFLFILALLHPMSTTVQQLKMG